MTYMLRKRPSPWDPLENDGTCILDHLITRKTAVRTIDEVAVKKRVNNLIMDGNVHTLRQMYDSGEWTDIDMSMDSSETDDHTWHYTALTLAACDNQVGVVNFLLERGAQVNERRAWHALPSNAAAAEGHVEVLNILRANGCTLSRGDQVNFTPAHGAASRGQLPILELLHRIGVPLDTPDVNRRTPSDCATSEVQAAIAKLLQAN